jgi:hypothetical protein
MSQFKIDTKRSLELIRVLSAVPSSKWSTVYPERTIALTIPMKVVGEEEERLRHLWPEPDLFNRCAVPKHFVLQSILGRGGDYHMVYDVNREGDILVTLLFDTKESALNFKHTFKFADFEPVVETR